jgi:mono/diheme cytochrome c family protein
MKLRALTRLSLAAAAGLIVSCGGAPQTRAGQIAALGGRSAQGQGLYQYYACASCHGNDGTGTPSSNNVSIAARVKVLAPEVFIGKILDGVTGTEMTPYGYLTDQQLADLYAYVASVLGR